MSYFTERHGMRAPIERTSTMTSEMYALLFDCCEKYYDNIAWKFPEQCPDGNGICGLDHNKFNNELLFEIPTLFRGYSDTIAKPSKKEYSRDDEDFDQYALLDLIELIANSIRDISNRFWHSFFRHDDMSFSKTSDEFVTFCDEINNIFKKTGLLYTLTDKKRIERIIENNVLTKEVEVVVKTVKEPGTRELLEEAIIMFRQPNPAASKTAVEKLWDAFERLKTYHTNLDKKASAEAIVNSMGNGQAEFVKLFNDEFKALTDIGNGFRIRHHETSKTDIIDVRHYDYFFNRCLSLISSAISYL
jgi:hypothetical protein